MKTKILILGLACLLMLGSALSAWEKLFTEPIETLYIFMKDGTIFQHSNQDEVMINMNIGMLEKELRKFKGKNYSIKEIKLIIHNHQRKNYFSRSDYRQHRILKSYGFNGLFLMYCHRTNKTYDIEDEGKSE